MADQSELLSVEDTAKRFGVSTKTIRRRIQDGSLVAHRLGTTIRVDAKSVARLLAPANGNGVGCVVAMRENNSEELQLYRQRGRDKNWTTLVDGIEMSLDTSDAEEARAKLEVLASRVKQSKTKTGRPRTGKWTVVHEPTRGFVIKYYDRNSRRKNYRIPRDLEPPITSQDEAEKYAERWYDLHVLEQQMADVRDVVQGTGDVPPSNDTTANPTGPTFGDVAKSWTSGELAKLYPDHVKTKRSGMTDARRLNKYARPAIGDVPIVEFTGRKGIELVERVCATMTKVNPKLLPVSRQHVLQTVAMVLNLAVFPLKLIEANPLPKGFIPRRGPKRAKVALYPDEELRLLRCTRVPLQWRLLIGILSREGMRLTELLLLEFANVDLAKGLVNLDENKTDDARSWALDPSVTEALRRWKKLLSSEALKKERFMVHPKSGRVLSGDKAAKRLRRYARLAGLDRKQLFEKSDVRMPLRIHDLRATFVTTALAQGKSEVWVADRTGHRSSAMIFTYKRAARSFQELGLGPLAPLHEAIPELAEVVLDSE
jgi:excisionase family DNA binding protein